MICILGMVLPLPIAICCWYARGLPGYHCSANGECVPEPYLNCPFDSFLKFDKLDSITVVERGEAQIRKMVRSNITPAVLHIGPNTLDDNEIEYYINHFAAIPSWPSSSFQAVFVEPFKGALRNLTENARRIGGNLQIINAAVAVNNSDNDLHNVTMYSFDEHFSKACPELLELFPLRHSDYWNSLSEEVLVNTFYTAILIYGLTNKMEKYCPQFKTLEHLRSYVRQFNIRSFRAAELLKAAGLAPEQVTMLIIDAEGFDQDIADEFLAIDGFKPFYFRFELDIHRCPSKRVRDTIGIVPKIAQVFRKLHSRGYDVHRYDADALATLALDVD